MSKHGSLVYQVEKILKDKAAFGEAKHSFKSSQEYKDYVFSFNTMRTYLREGVNFCQWCKEKYGCKTVEACKRYVSQYLKQIRQKNGKPYSAWSLATKAAAIAKLYGTSKLQTPRRERKNIKRSRLPREMDKRYSEERNADLDRFLDAAGLRRREAEALTGVQMRVEGEKLLLTVHNGKGGKYREVPILADKRFVFETMRKAGANKVFPYISSACDVHAHRAKYAENMYKAYARPYAVCKKSGFYDPTRRVWCSNAVYRCRKDKAGIWYDKQALLIVSKALGHNRISVVAEHYLYGLEK